MRSILLCFAVIFFFVGRISARPNTPYYDVDHEMPLDPYEDPYTVTSKHDYYLYNSDVPDPVKPAPRENMDYDSYVGTGYNLVFSHGVEDQTEVKSADQVITVEHFKDLFKEQYGSEPTEYNHYMDYKK